ncbi:hypothetical protein Cgig2_014209 [Carnegiea gigantea]|uniref:gibberellin 3beta-dioxygenase n=1 Tax=Carnegiea gigantea TaxID=171969 RepID=A0A9Q1H0Z0_9CARY|nr:hypothetical protein Cgig2_014209 [Carnegiea gigantea]
MPSRCKSHPVHHLPNKPCLDFKSLKELPDSFKWAPLDGPSRALELESESESESESVPVVDLNDPNAQKLIGLACKAWGVFQVINHGVSKSLLDKIEACGKSLFALPVQQKLKAVRSADGVTGYGPARISSFFPKRMWSEGFTIVGSPLEHARQLWPNDYSKFCAIIEEYQNEMNTLAEKLMWLILGSLGISTRDVKWAASPTGANPFKGASGVIQLNSYPACPDPSRAMGLAAHTDSTLLTILHQSSTSGLQVFQEWAGSWVMVPPISGGLVINIGDLLHIISNGLYSSVYHRAVVNKTRHRLSVAYLYGPEPNVRIQPLPKLSDANRPPLYRPVTWSEYLGIKGKHFDKTLSLIRLNNDSNEDNDNNSTLINGLKRGVDRTKSIKVDSNTKILAAFA